MTSLLRTAHLLSTSFGLMMVAAAGFQTTGVALVVAMVAGVAVLAGIVLRVAATVAVLSAAAAIVISDAPPMLAALAGLSAACYLVLRYTEAGLAGVPAVQGDLRVDEALTPGRFS